jgi:hypothetical protein
VLERPREDKSAKAEALAKRTPAFLGESVLLDRAQRVVSGSVVALPTNIEFVCAGTCAAGT